MERETKWKLELRGVTSVARVVVECRNEVTERRMEHDERKSDTRERERDGNRGREPERERETREYYICAHCEGGLAADIQVNCKRVKAWRKD